MRYTLDPFGSAAGPGVVRAVPGDPMTEILTESFCERCGTRYTFESARPRMRLKGVRVLSRGLKNFVLSDDTSMDEAMASARSETDRESTSYQLDAFHKTFNFCMSCRQYTCPNCWNEAEARCLTCAPHLGHEIMPAPFPDLATTGLIVANQVGANGSNGSNGAVDDTGLQEIGAEAAARTDDTPPEADMDVAARLEALDAAALPAVEVEAALEVEGPVEIEAKALEVEAPVEALAEAPVEIEAEAPVEAVADAPVEIQAEAPVEIEAEPLEVEAPVEVEAEDHEAAARLAAMAAAAIVVQTAEPEDVRRNLSVGDKTAAQTAGLLRRFRPSQNLDAELDAYEHDRAAALAASDVAIPNEAPLVAGEVEVEPEAAARPDAPVVEPQIAAGAPEAETPAIEAPPVVDDVVSQPTWRMVAPDPGAEGPAVKPVDAPAAIPPAAIAANPDAAPQWPTRPSVAPSTGLAFLGRPVAPQGGLEALWAESNREVVASPLRANRPAGGVQPCVSCGLSLSATARFCRRCGTPQAS